MPGSSVYGSGLSMTILGCGTMGIAILSGILSSLREINGPRPLQVPSSGASTPMEEIPAKLPSRFIACVRRPESAKKVKTALWEYSSELKVRQYENVLSVQQSEVVILGCKPWAIKDILTEPGIKAALDGKLLISICAGVTVEHVEAILATVELPDRSPDLPEWRCTVLRAMPNTASLIRESMTVIATPDTPLPQETLSLVTWIFKRIGDVVYLPAATMDASTALCGSGPAFFAIMLEAAIDGAVAMGLPRADAQRMAAQTMRGAAGLVLNGDHPALLKDKVSTPGGCTIGGLLVLEEGGIRGTVSRAVREATVVASQLGKGVQGVNGTRHGLQ
jgi:pyrroline-5-carboxylate reductase